MEFLKQAKGLYSEMIQKSIESEERLTEKGPREISWMMEMFYILI